MLRLSRDRFVIALTPTRLSMVRLEGRLQQRVVDSASVEYEPALGVESWQGAVDALSQVAARIRDVRADVTVVLSNHFVRYVLVPTSEGLDRVEEELGFARYCFAKIHGARSKSWDVRMSEGAEGEERVASAIDGSLLQSIQACFPDTGKARLASVQPYLMAAFNQWRRVLGLDRAWFLLLEPQRFCLAHLEDGRWTGVRNTKGDFNEPAQWAAQLDRELHLVPGSEAPAGVYVLAPNAAKAETAEAEGWHFKILPTLPIGGLSAADAAPLSMALSAA